MRISYKKLWILLIEKDISPATLRKDLSIATGTMTKLRKNEEVALSVLLRICQYLHCNIGDICDAVESDIDAKRSDTVYVSLLYVLYYAAANAAKKNHEKIPGAPKACRVSASYCICSQLMRARFAG